MKHLKTIILSIKLLFFVGVFSGCQGWGGTQEITASQVQDEQSLKEFVRAARDFLENDYEKAVTQFRENSRWKHGAVYLFIVDEHETVHLHAGNFMLDGQESLRLTDARTGEVIVDQFLEKGLQRGGGFVEYHIDNPEKPGKDVSKKVAYVISFKKGREKTDFVVGAGFFPDDEN